MANDITGINDIYNNGLNDAYGQLPQSQNQLPKTGQTISYQAGDDGDIEAGLGLETRFEELNIGGDDVVIDHLTGLMWPRDRNQAGTDHGSLKTWTQAVSFGNNLVFAGFDDWRIPNMLEFLSIFNFGTERLYSTFINFATSCQIWSGTTRSAVTSTAGTLYNASMGSSIGNKTDTKFVIAVRTA